MIPFSSLLWGLRNRYKILTDYRYQQKWTSSKRKYEENNSGNEETELSCFTCHLWIKFYFTEKVLFHCLTLLPNNLPYDTDYKKLSCRGCAFENAFAPTTKIELKYNQRFSKRSGKYPAQMSRQPRALLYSAGQERTLLKPILQDVSARHWWLS